MHADLTLTHIQAAAERIKNHAVKTPLLENEVLNQRTNARILLKPESLQKTGSFKFRGAFNKVAQLSVAQLKLGVVACSSGNHAQGLARAAQIASCPATIVMPKDAPHIKIDNTKRYGAEVVLYDRYTESREEIAEGIAADTGALFVPPYDDFDIMAGQGTVGLEIAEACLARDDTVDTVLVAASGGGLAAGVSTAIKSLLPVAQTMTVEPHSYDDHARSFAQGSRATNVDPKPSICDALLAPEPGERTFTINRETIRRGLVVTDEEVKDAIRFAFTELKLVLEPGGAATLAAVLNNTEFQNQTVAIVLSGGNIDPKLFTNILGET